MLLYARSFMNGAALGVPLQASASFDDALLSQTTQDILADTSLQLDAELQPDAYTDPSSVVLAQVGIVEGEASALDLLQSESPIARSLLAPRTPIKSSAAPSWALAPVFSLLLCVGTFFTSGCQNEAVPVTSPQAAIAALPQGLDQAQTLEDSFRVFLPDDAVPTGEVATTNPSNVVLNISSLSGETYELFVSALKAEHSDLHQQWQAEVHPLVEHLRTAGNKDGKPDSVTLEELNDSGTDVDVEAAYASLQMARYIVGEYGSRVSNEMIARSRQEPPGRRQRNPIEQNIWLILGTLLAGLVMTGGAFVRTRRQLTTSRAQGNERDVELQNKKRELEDVAEQNSQVRAQLEAAHVMLREGDAVLARYSNARGIHGKIADLEAQLAHLKPYVDRLEALEKQVAFGLVQKGRLAEVRARYESILTGIEAARAAVAAEKDKVKGERSKMMEELERLEQLRAELHAELEAHPPEVIRAEQEKAVRELARLRAAVAELDMVQIEIRQTWDEHGDVAAKIAASQSSLRELRDRIRQYEELSDEYTELSGAHPDIVIRIQRLTEQLQALVAQIEERDGILEKIAGLEKSNPELAEQIRSLSARLEKLREEEGTLRKARSDVNTQVEELAAENEQSRAFIGSLEQQLEIDRDNERELDALQLRREEEHTEIRGRISELTERKGEIEAAIAGATQELAKLDGDVEAVEARQTELQGRVDGLLAEKRGYEDIIEGLEETEAEVREDIAVAERRQAELRTDIAAREAERDEALLEKSRLAEESRELREETIPGIETKLAETRAQAEAYRKERDEKNEELDAAQSERDELVDQVVEVEARISVTQTRVEGLRSDLATKEETQGGLEEAERGLKTNIRRADESIRKLRVSIEGRRAVDEQETLVQQKLAAKLQLDLVERRLEAGDIDEDQAVRERKSPQLRLERFRSEILKGHDGLQAKRDELLEIISELTAEQSVLEERLAALGPEKQADSDKRDELKDELQSEQVYRELQEAELEELEGTKTAALEKKAELQANIAAARAAIEGLGEDKVSLEADLSAAEKQRAEAQTQKEGVEAKLREARQAAIQLTTEIGEKRGELQQAESERDTARAELDELSSGIEAVRAEHDEITAQMTAHRELIQQHEEALGEVAAMLQARGMETMPEAIAAVRTSLTTLQEQVTELKRLEGEREELREQHRGISTRITELQKRIGEARDRKKTADERIRELERTEVRITAEAERNESRIADLLALQERRDELRNNLGELQPREEVEAEIDQLETEYRALENDLLPKMRMLRSNIESLRGEHGDVEAEIERLEEEERQEAERQAELEGTVRGSEARLAELRGKVSELQERRDALAEDIELQEGLLAEGVGLETEHELLRGKIEKARADRDAAQEAVTAAEERNAALEAEAAELGARLETLEREHTDLSADRAAIAAAYAEAAQATDHEIRIEPIAVDTGEHIELRIPVGMETLNIQRRRKDESGMSISYADGRGSLEIDSETVSRNHAQISRRDDGHYEIVDLGSSNGTFIRRGGGIRHKVEGEPVKLLKYDVLQIGKEEIKIMDLPGSGDDGSGVRRSGGRHSAASRSEAETEPGRSASQATDSLGRQLRLVQREIRELGRKRDEFLARESEAGDDDLRAQIAQERYKTVESAYAARRVEQVLLGGSNERVAFEANRHTNGNGFLTITVGDDRFFLYPRDAIGIEGAIETALDLVTPMQRGVVDRIATQFTTALDQARAMKAEPEEAANDADIAPVRLLGEAHAYVQSAEVKLYGEQEGVRIQLKPGYYFEDKGALKGKIAMPVDGFSEDQAVPISIYNEDGDVVKILKGQADAHGVSFFMVDPVEVDEAELLPESVIMEGVVPDPFNPPIHAVEATVSMGEYAMTTTQGAGYKIKGKVLNQDGVGAAYDENGDLHLIDVDEAGGHGEGTNDAARLSLEHFVQTVETATEDIALTALTAANQAVVAHNQHVSRDEEKSLAAAVAAHISQPKAENEPYRAFFHWLADTRGMVIRGRRGGGYAWRYRTVDEGVVNALDLLKPGEHFAHGGEGRTIAMQVFPMANQITNALGWQEEADIRTTEEGAVPDSSSADGRRDATEFAEGVPLQVGDIVILGSDGLWENFGSVETIMGIIAHCKSTEEMVRALTHEAHLRMNILEQAKQKIPRKSDARMRFEHHGRVIYVNRKGHVFENEVGGPVVEHFKNDNFSVVIYEHNPIALMNKPRIMRRPD